MNKLEIELKEKYEKGEYNIKDFIIPFHSIRHFPEIRGINNKFVKGYEYSMITLIESVKAIAYANLFALKFFY